MKYQSLKKIGLNFSLSDSNLRHKDNLLTFILIFVKDKLLIESARENLIFPLLNLSKNSFL